MTKLFSVVERNQTFDALDGQHYDLVVIGGGITGAGIFRDAVLRGLRTLLVEREDFASGTSSKSSKLVHGGLRYLEHFHIRLTRESCRERELLLRLNPHLVRPMPFMFPIYRDSRLHPLFIRMGLRFYEYLAGPSAIPHRMLKDDEIRVLAPALRTGDLRRVALYYDSTVDDARLVSENVIDGVVHGGLALNYVAATGFALEQDRIVGVKLRDVERDRRVQVQADQVVNATGIHVDGVRGKAAPVEQSELRASKGVHVVVSRQRLPLDATVAFMNRVDGRLMFAVPWGNVVLVGTTDTFDHGDVRTTTYADLGYVLKAMNATFDGTPFGEADVISSIAGVRTLIVTPGKSEQNASSVSREHAIYQDPGGLISIAGGKLTTYRIMAMDIVDLVVGRLPAARRAGVEPCSTHERPLGGAVSVDEKKKELRRRFDVDEVCAEQLVRSYGARAHEPLEQAQGAAELRRPIVDGAPYLRAEVPYLCRRECVLHLDDLLTRRLRVAVWVPGQAVAEAAEVAALAAPVLGWDAARQAVEVERYQNLVREQFRPRDDA